MSKETWCFSYNGETFYSHDELTSRDEAHAFALQEGEQRLQDGLSVWIGKRKPPYTGEEFIPTADDIIEQMVCAAGEDVGDVSEIWLEFVSKEHKKLLDEMLSKTIMEWMEKTDNKPMFFGVEDVEEITAQGARSDDEPQLLP